MGRAGDVIGTIRVDVMMTVIGDPAAGRASSVEHGPEDQEVLDEFIELERLMRQSAVIADGGAQPAEHADHERDAEDFPSWHGKQDQSDDGENVDEDKI